MGKGKCVEGREGEWWSGGEGWSGCVWTLGRWLWNGWMGEGGLGYVLGDGENDGVVFGGVEGVAEWWGEGKRRGEW